MAIYGIPIAGILAIIVGILVLVWPKLIRLGLGFYLIIIGILEVLKDLQVF
ncbi:MAG: DUF3096 domain-containing protein [Candidatus Nanoarchaeia archaeon]